jgi:hypothetical protein
VHPIVLATHARWYTALTRSLRSTCSSTRADALGRSATRMTTPRSRTDHALS